MPTDLSARCIASRFARRYFDRSNKENDMEQTVKILVHEGELSVAPEATGAKIVRHLKMNRQASRFEIEIPEREAKPITTGDQHGREGI